jgi:hypothetical protein
MPGVVNLASPDGEMPISRALQAYPDRLFPRTTGNVLRESFYWRAARFNGRDGCVHIPNKPAIQSNTLSIECWFRSTQPFNHRFWPGSATLISTATSGPGSSDWVITAASQRNQDEGRLLAETGPQGKPSDLYLQSKENDPLNDGFWHHVVLTRSAEGLACLYVDGARHATGSDGGGKVIADRAINIGGEVIHPGGTFLNGDMDEVALYTHVLSAERVRAHYEAIRPHLGERPTKVKPPSSKPAAQEPAPAKPILWAEPAPLKPSIANAAKNHWAFQPLQESRVPDVQPRAWIHNDIDAFILATLKAEGLTPARPGDSLTFLRRANFDLLGLPPSPAEINTFADHPDVDQLIDQLIDRLLASPHYGERYGRHWLDVVRFADSAGYEIDYYYHHAAPYRDYVIASFNQDKPFDLFIREQLAADEVAADDPALRYATGLLTIGPWKFATGVDRRAASEYERLTDVADTVGTAFLGLTVGCARCHDHKSDPISQHDYFGLHAMIAPASLWDTSTNENAYNKNEKEKNWVVQVPDESPLIRLFTRGQFSNEGPAVRPTLFASISGRLVESDDQAYRKRRSRLADWLVSENNPLTARVIANRVWAWHFGAGLVRTANDFGPNGEAPSHPELLDYLAAELIRNDWQLKPLHRLIMSSATYRMASGSHVSERDPDNRLLQHFPRRRLEAEAIWDHLHATAGTLNLKAGGPAVVPPISEDLKGTLLNTNWKVADDPSEWTRRGVYMVVRRSIKWPFFDAFNVNTPTASCGRRDRTVVAPQALHLLNGPIAVTQARAFAGRLLRETRSEAGLIQKAWILAFARLPSGEERAYFTEQIQARSGALKSQPERPAPLNPPGGFDPAYGAAVVEFCLAIMNANEFIYVD